MVPLKPELHLHSKEYETVLLIIEFLFVQTPLAPHGLLKHRLVEKLQSMPVYPAGQTHAVYVGLHAPPLKQGNLHPTKN